MLCTKTALHFSRRITDRVTTLISGGTLVGSPDTLTIHDSTWLLIAVLPCSLTKNKDMPSINKPLRDGRRLG
jgi:hypothetical protein